MDERDATRPDVKSEPETAAAPPRVLILSASIGEGHDLPARELARGLLDLAPDGEIQVMDGLAAMGPIAEWIAMHAANVDTPWANRLFDINYWLLANFPPTRALTGSISYALGAARLARLVEQQRPHVVVSTYPGVTEALGRLRQRGRLGVPAVSAITDLAALRYWSHPGIDLHLVTHPESVAEVRSIAPDSEVVPVRGLNSPDFTTPRSRTEARRALGLPAEPKIVVVSGGGWAVGDLEGAVDTALGVDETVAIVLCGRNEEVRTRMERRYAGRPRVRVMGFTDRMPDLMAAADALVHSTAGLTVLEALVSGCPTISYGWGRGHIRANNRAFERFGLAEVASDRPGLEAALRRALRRRPARDTSFAELPTAASLVLGLTGTLSRREQVGDRG
jgi:UDP-N-acetylglucosamine:LPS N-acetylglucosamine transferase